MQSFIRSFTLFFVLAFTASVAHAASNTTTPAPSLSVITPNGLTECKQYNLTWEHGTAPYKLFVYYGCDSSNDSDDPIIEVENISGKWAEWEVSLVNGTSVMLGVEDAGGVVAYSGDVTIAKGSNACIGKNATWTLPPTSNLASNSNSISIGNAAPTTAHPTGTNTGIANVASGGPNTPKTGGASSLKASGALAVVMAVIAVAASS